MHLQSRSCVESVCERKIRRSRTDFSLFGSLTGLFRRSNNGSRTSSRVTAIWSDTRRSRSASVSWSLVFNLWSLISSKRAKWFFNSIRDCEKKEEEKRSNQYCFFSVAATCVYWYFGIIGLMNIKTRCDLWSLIFPSLTHSKTRFLLISLYLLIRSSSHICKNLSTSRILSIFLMQFGRRQDSAQGLAHSEAERHPHEHWSVDLIFDFDFWFWLLWVSPYEHFAMAIAPAMSAEHCWAKCNPRWFCSKYQR